MQAHFFSGVRTKATPKFKHSLPHCLNFVMSFVGRRRCQSFLLGSASLQKNVLAHFCLHPLFCGCASVCKQKLLFMCPLRQPRSPAPPRARLPGHRTPIKRATTTRISTFHATMATTLSSLCGAGATSTDIATSPHSLETVGLNASLQTFYGVVGL